MLTVPNHSPINFSLVWASGEDSDINKWGWQLEPWLASVPSTDAMFVTSAVKWGNWTTTGVQSPRLEKITILSRL